MVDEDRNDPHALQRTTRLNCRRQRRVFSAKSSIKSMIPPQRIRRG